MPVAIIGGTGVYNLTGMKVEERRVETEYGEALLYMGTGEHEDIIFLTRHGVSHATPPHKINYRANIRALKDCGVQRVVATYAVGAISRAFPLKELVVLRDFLNYTSGRESTFFDQFKDGAGHVEMSTPFCPVLSDKLMELAPACEVKCHDGGVYVATNGPRFETPAEIRAYSMLGGHVVGMTCVPEVILAAELGMNFAAVALPINWAAGLESSITLVEGDIDKIREKMMHLMLAALKETNDDQCQAAKLL